MTAPHEFIVPLIRNAMRDRGYVEAAKDFDARAKDYWAAHFAILMRLWGVQ